MIITGEQLFCPPFDVQPAFAEPCSSDEESNVTSNQILQLWIEEVSELTQPDNIHWCTGSAEENQQFEKTMLATGEFIELNQ